MNWDLHQGCTGFSDCLVFKDSKVIFFSGSDKNEDDDEVICSEEREHGFITIFYGLLANGQDGFKRIKRGLEEGISFNIVEDGRSQLHSPEWVLSVLQGEEPKNVNEALTDKIWIVAMQEELTQFIANDVWELVPQPKNMTIIGTKWVFRNKLDENGIVSQNKARFKLLQMDVTSAFLNGFINEEVYVAQPPGFIDFEKPDHVYKLKKALYDLKQAPKLEILKKFSLKDSKPMKTPMSSDTKLMKDEECESVDSTKYRGMIGTMHLGLWYPKGTDIETVVYADSDHAGDYVAQKSTSSICTFVGCCLTYWFSKKQTALDISTTEAEYVSVEKACQQALWMKQALIDYDVRFDDVPIMCDNKGATDLSKNWVQHSRTRHIEIRHHFLRDNVQFRNDVTHSINRVSPLLSSSLDSSPRSISCRENLTTSSEAC
ncbi:retrovirus-related pol polyprotein from transposon TNT 1-94 [Tanacetum coccineum]